ncbi:MAG: glycosyltransferase family 4 protein [Candidatus Peribacteraceae bacterium]|nr:glycosyltransferase family 4 protein [Candidatus Peribacteraceae bacterium]MDD5739315.1 glycosyltransferase family 4 protein [Candidatus Peribacteraceae bacterium]
MKKTTCAFGFYDLEGQRSWVIRKGIEESGYDVVLCRTDARGFLPKIRDLFNQWKKIECSLASTQEPKLAAIPTTINRNQRDEIIARRRASPAWSATTEGRVGSWEGHRRWPSHAIDALYVVFPGHYVMPLAWWLARKRKIPIILDVFISLYETEVEDRKRVSQWNPKAWMLWLIDWSACALAETILIDTEEHRDFFVKRYRIAREKFLVIPVGCRTDLFFPRATEQQETFRVRFHGSFIPLHGVETILHAAQELKNDGIVFELAGKGQTLPAMQKLAEELDLTNVRFVGMKPLREIPDFIAGADACLGIFGTGAKAKRVIPTKAFEILAMGKPLITARSPATERVFRDRENAMLVTAGDPRDLAEKIRELKTHSDIAASIAQNGRSLFLKKFQPWTVVEPLVAWLQTH